VEPWRFRRILNPAVVEVDVVLFERRVAEATATTLQEAAELYQGDLLAGLAVSEAGFEEWLLPERERLRELAIDALAKLLVYPEVRAAQQKLSATHQAVDDLTAQLERDLSERRAAADRALVEVERQHRERRTELEAEERDLVARIQALRDELRGLAAKAGAL